MKKSIISVLAIFSLTFSVAIAQSLQVEGIKNSRFNGVNPIYTNNDGEIKGYYTYYMVDKGEKGQRTFEFALFDKDLKAVKKTPITVHKKNIINNTVFNGKYFLISYTEIKNKQIVFNIIDDNGKIVKSKTQPLDKKRTASSIYASAGDGFYVVQSKALGNKYGYSIEKVDNNLEKVWSKDVLPQKGAKSVADLISTDNRFVIWEENSPKLGSKKIKPAIVCFDSKTGNKIFERDGFDGVSTILYNQIKIEKDGGIIAGGAYVDGEKYKVVNNTGVYFLKLDSRGKEVLYTKVNNKEKIQDVLRATNQSLSLGSKDKLLVEDIVHAGDYYYVISEMFKINWQAVQRRGIDRITGKYIGNINNDAKPQTLQIMDYVVFKFDAKGGLVEIKPIKKEQYNRISCYAPYSAMYGMDLAKRASKLGWFDYGFVVVGKDGKTKMVCSNNTKPRTPEVYIYSFEESYAQKKINLKQEAKLDVNDAKVSFFKVLKNQTNQIVVAYYQKKARLLTLNSEVIE